MSTDAPRNVGPNGARSLDSRRASRVADRHGGALPRTQHERPTTEGAVMRTLVPRQPDRAVGIRRHRIHVPIEMIFRIIRFSSKAGASLYYKGLLAPLLRAALMRWIEKADRCPLEDTREEIRRAEPEYGMLLSPSELAISNELAVKLDGLREKLGGDLSKYAAKGRSALLWAALTPWLEDAERDPRAALGQILAELVKGSRKPNQ